MPCPIDQLWIWTDGSVKKTQYWSPDICGQIKEVIILLITQSSALLATMWSWGLINYFSLYLIQSKHHPAILTESRPCVPASEKLCRGQFAASPRLTSFLSTVSRFQASIQHLADRASIPADIASRNAPDCSHSTCLVCTFVREQEEATVFRT